jgi:peptide/nickel transport system ATP-binding protein
MNTASQTVPVEESEGREGAGALLEVRDLTVEYMTPRGPARAVDQVSFSVAPGEVFGLAGESGCGKSTTAHAIMRLIKPPGRISAGQILFRGQDVLSLPSNELRNFRWTKVSIVSQGAMNALNPVISLGAQLRDAIRAHEKMSKARAQERAEELFRLVNIDTSRLHSFAHELSGGMRQRAMIAMALALNAELIILDEPTTALDVVVQREILQEIEDLQAKFGFSILFITHDLSLLVEFSTRIAIMYAAKIVELAPAAELFEHPMHPYTVGLMNSFPSISGPKLPLQGIPGSPPGLVSPPRGCRFHPRCPRCSKADEELYRLQTGIEPALQEARPGHWVACHLYP